GCWRGSTAHCEGRRHQAHGLFRGRGVLVPWGLLFRATRPATFETILARRCRFRVAPRLAHDPGSPFSSFERIGHQPGEGDVDAQLVPVQTVATRRNPCAAELLRGSPGESRRPLRPESEREATTQLHDNESAAGIVRDGARPRLYPVSFVSL